MVVVGLPILCKTCRLEVADLRLRCYSNMTDILMQGTFVVVRLMTSCLTPFGIFPCGYRFLKRQGKTPWGTNIKRESIGERVFPSGVREKGRRARGRNGRKKHGNAAEAGHHSGAGRQREDL